MIDLLELREKFRAIYAGEPRFFRAPGRVNLIGEHTDYNGGFVLPMAIDREAAAAIRTREDRRVRVHTANFGETAEFDLDAPAPPEKGFWLNFIEGVARILERGGARLKGADVLIWSDVPAGGGLSSSAALEVVAGLALMQASGQNVDKTTLALAGQQTEHEFVGAKVGIMDQFVSAHAEAGHALLLDCRSLEFETVPLDTSRAAIVICNTNVKHDLAASEYNTRRAECERGVEILKKFLPGIEQLRDVDWEEFERYADRLPETIGKRCRHVVTENRRTLEAAECLKRNDLTAFGLLMLASHESLRDDYEVSCRELDALVEIAGGFEGAIGARMTGGGFGGSTVNLVERERVEEFTRLVYEEYPKRTGIEPTVLVSEPGDGAREVFI